MIYHDLSTAAHALRLLIEPAKHIVFFGGAGVSTESGIPDFRSVDGLYNQTYDYPPETILSRSFFKAHPQEFYRFYRDKMLFDETVISPNAAHKYLAALERQKQAEGGSVTVVTQNIDGLHTKAGSRVVCELHGSIHRNFCMDCGHSAPLRVIRESQGVPKCPLCGGILKPDVVLYEEPLNEAVCDAAIDAIYHADLLVVGGTSMTVYPAAGMVRYFRGGPAGTVVINRDSIELDDQADTVIRCPIGQVFNELTSMI